MKMLKYIDFTNESSNRTSSSLSFYKINERATDGEVVKPWPEVDLVKFRLLNKDSETDLKAYFKEKFVQGIYELLTKNRNLYTNSQTAVDEKLKQNFIKTKTKTWTYKEIGGWIETRWNDLVFLKTSFIEAQDKEYLLGIEKSIWDKEYAVLNGRNSSDAIMSTLIYNYKGEDKILDPKSSDAYVLSIDGGKNRYLNNSGIISPDSDYWKTRYTKIINDRKINDDEEYKKIFKLINTVTTDFTDLQWKIQGEFISLYVYFMTRLYANAIAKDIDKVDSKKLKELPKDDQGDQGDQGAQGTQGNQGTQGVQGTQGNQGAQDKPIVAPVKKRKRVVSPTPTYDRENIRRANKSFGW